MKKIVFIIAAMLSIAVSSTMALSDNNTHENTHALTKEQKKKEKQRLADIKTQLDNAKTNIKGGKDLTKVESAMDQLLRDTLNKDDKRLYYYRYEAIKKQYEQANEKLYLKEKYDTASLFLLARKMYLAAESLDSVDVRTSKDGDAEYRRSNSNWLRGFYGNLYSGGIYMFNHDRYKDASAITDTYLSAPSQPMFSDSKIGNDTLRQFHTAYLNLASNYRAKDYDNALKWQSLALRHQSRREQVMQYLCDIYSSRNDTANYMSLLNEGVESYPLSDYFYPRLVDIYCDLNDYEKALHCTDIVMAADSTDILILTTRQTILLNLERYDECITMGKAILAGNDSLASVNYNVAVAYYNQTLAIQRDKSLTQKERTKAINALYRQCRPYMERYRELAPEEKDKWKPILYNIYLNLNLGKQFAEIEVL